jgi:hypothetical protein
MVWRRVVGFLGLGAMGLLPLSAWALSCAEPVADARQFHDHDAVFVGDVLMLYPDSPTHMARKADVQVVYVWKGVTLRDVVSVVEDKHWQNALQPGRRALFLVNAVQADGAGEYVQPLCGFGGADMPPNNPHIRALVKALDAAADVRSPYLDD